MSLTAPRWPFSAARSAGFLPSWSRSSMSAPPAKSAETAFRWVYAKLRPFHPLTAVNAETGETESLRQELVTMGFNKMRHEMKAAMHKVSRRAEGLDTTSRSVA